MSTPQVDDVDQAEKRVLVARLLKERKESFGSWPKAGASGPYHHEHMRQIAVDEKEVPESTLDTLLSWLMDKPAAPDIDPPTPAERERLADLLRRLSTLLRQGYLPENVWARDEIPSGDRGEILSEPDGGTGTEDP